MLPNGSQVQILLLMEDIQQNNLIQVTQFVNSISNSNSYIIYSSDNTCWLIDVGDVQPILDWCDEFNLSIKGVFITHAHIDHIYGLNQLIEAIPDILIYAHRNTIKGLFDPKLNLSLYKGCSFCMRDYPTIVVKEHDLIDLFSGVLLEVLETPGHDWGAVCYRIVDKLFTGDSYIPYCKVVTSFPKSDKMKSIESLKKLTRYLEKGYTIYPGHGNSQFKNFDK